MKKLIVAIALMFACVTCGNVYAGSPVVQKSISSAHKTTKASKPKHSKKPVQTNHSSVKKIVKK